MKRFLVFLPLLLSPHPLAHAARPNVVFVLVDDLGYSDVACYGNPVHETPHVDRLAREGTRFTAAYTACAVCSPTRASIQTGRYPIRFGITDWIPGARRPNTPLLERPTETELPADAVTLGDAFRAGGYRTAFLGKWHLNAPGGATGFPEEQGYDVNIGGHHKGSPPGGYFAPFNNPKIIDKPDDHYLTDRLGDEAVRLIGDWSRGDRPFFLMLSFYTVHTPIQPKPDLRDHYKAKLAERPDPHWKQPAYAAMVHSMDVNVGRVLDALDNAGVADDTVVVFFSDNGGLHWQTSCHPLNKGKGFYHEGGVRVPLIVRKPGDVPAGAVCDAPVISNDFFPTLLDLAGLPLAPDAHLDGLSLAPLFAGAERLDRDALYWHYPHYHGAGETPVSAIRWGDYKLIRHYKDGRRELYDLSQDLGESRDLVAALPGVANEAERRLDAWLAERNAYLPGADPSFDATKPAGRRANRARQ